jgi:hypothetical protein
MEIVHTGFNRFVAQDFFDCEEVTAVLYHQASDGMPSKNVSTAGLTDPSFLLIVVEQSGNLYASPAIFIVSIE